MGLVEDVIRMSAERDGWREIACSLLRQAMGDIAERFEIPPIELVADPKRIESTRPQLRQWWADLTRTHAAQRSNGQAPTTSGETTPWMPGSIRFQLATDARAGTILQIGADGLLHPWEP